MGLYHLASHEPSPSVANLRPVGLREIATNSLLSRHGALFVKEKEDG